MKTKTINKISVSLAVLIAITVVADFVILQGGFKAVKADAAELARLRPAYDGEDWTVSRLVQPDKNIKVEKFSVVPKNSSIFVKNSPIEISCEIKNQSKIAIENMNSVIRTSNGGFSIANTKTLAPDESVTIKGEFMPKESGVIVAACRADIDEQIEEENENDNREVVALYVK